VTRSLRPGSNHRRVALNYRIPNRQSITVSRLKHVPPFNGFVNPDCGN
jgi:hypothetical protein